jgi:hypothetical protein
MDQNYIINMSKSDHMQHMNNIYNRLSELDEENDKLNDTNNNIADMINSVSKSRYYNNDEKNTLIKHLSLSLKTNNDMIGENLKDTGDMVEKQFTNLLNIEKNEEYISYLNSIYRERYDESNTQYNILKRELDTKRRVNEMNQYYEKKYKKQFEVARNSSYIAALIIIIVLISQKIPIGDFVFSTIIGGLMGALVIYVGYSSLDIYLRDKTNFDEYDIWAYDAKEKNIKPSYDNIHLEPEPKCW